MILREAIMRSAAVAADRQRADGSFAPGHNGPWRQPETPCRVTAHWAILLAYAHVLTGDRRYRSAALEAGAWLSSGHARPYGFAFDLRHARNRGNGLIGQAWAIEALLVLGRLFGRDDWLGLAEDVVLQHAFADRIGLWHSLEIDGRRLRLNRVVNQHVWFGAMATALARLRGHPTLQARARRFGERLALHVDWTRLDLSHLTWVVAANRAIDRPAAAVAARLGPVLFRKGDLRELSIGYLSFLLYGLALLRDVDPSLPIWTDRAMQDGLRAAVQRIARSPLPGSGNRYAWSYNPTGIEMAYVVTAFGLEEVKPPVAWIDEQFDRQLDSATGLMDRHTGDAATLAARLYEAVRVDAAREMADEAARVFRLMVP